MCKYVYRMLFSYKAFFIRIISYFCHFDQVNNQVDKTLKPEVAVPPVNKVGGVSRHQNLPGFYTGHAHKVIARKYWKIILQTDHKSTCILLHISFSVMLIWQTISLYQCLGGSMTIMFTRYLSWIKTRMLLCEGMSVTLKHWWIIISFLLLINVHTSHMFTQNIICSAW